MARSKSSTRWLQEHFSDPYVKRAQAEGWRSRAVFKLEELLQRDAILKPGMVVVDLGAAPGGWSQMVREKLGDRGRVIALDILPMQGIAGVDFIEGDFREEAVLRLLRGPLSLREIGQELFLSANTIKTHTRAIYRKLGVSTRTEAVERGYETGLLP